MSYYPEPPYLLLVAGLLASFASGLAFDATLKGLVNEWSRTRSTRILNQLQGVQLFIPFVGIAGGIWIFLASGLEIYGFPMRLSYIISLVLTLGTAALIWSQLGKLLVMLQTGGSKALDLDSWE